ncbi:MAG: type II toxin-antitoxin system VapC family toxin [Actinobacteria bacterium]|nr:type II toxin-antitoxin system VapC family toxin [Actinomycetota bacterium]
MAVALVVTGHEANLMVTDALQDKTLGLAGHASFETYSVLTRLPAPARRSASDVARLLAQNFPETKFLSEQAQRSLLQRLSQLGVSGGSVYDALIGETARVHHLRLATRDQRAVPAYRALDIDFDFLE